MKWPFSGVRFPRSSRTGGRGQRKIKKIWKKYKNVQRKKFHIEKYNSFIKKPTKNYSILDFHFLEK